jgi:hypothetical protein
MTGKQKEAARKSRIADERKRMALKPWQYAPSEVDDGPNPYPPSAGAHQSWIEAQQWRAEIRASDPEYFNRFPPADELDAT